LDYKCKIMKYTLEISKKIEIVDVVLEEINVPNLLKSPDFYVDEMSINSCLRVNFVDKGENKIPLSLTFTPTGLEVRLDKVNEAIDWSDKDFMESNTVIKSVLKNLFTSYVLVEHYGYYRTRISLFGQDGMCTNIIKHQEGISFKGKRRDRLYFPIYP